MRTLLHRLFGFTRTRGFDAAGGGRRWEGARTVDGLNTAILAGATTAARRAGWYARNNPWVAAAVDSLVGNVVGAGIKPQSTHSDRAVRERLQVLWLRWTDHADPGGPHPILVRKTHLCYCRDGFRFQVHLTERN